MNTGGYRTATVAVLFCDCHDFSRVMNELGTERTLAFVDGFYRRVGDEIVSRDGRIVKYIGDSILAYFDAEEAGRSVRSAVDAARGMRRTYAELAANERLQTETELEVGIAFGPCELGEVGHPSLRTFDIFGDTVNQAAVICHYRGIAITAQTREALGDNVDLERLPDRTVKWREEPLALWAVR